MLGYNRMTGYNKARYNAEGTELAASDTLTMADQTVTKRILKAASDLFITADSIAKQQNKTFEDAMKLDVWLRVNREDSSKWGD